MPESCKLVPHLSDGTKVIVDNKLLKANNPLLGPLQPDDKQCGYYMMRFMRDIITGFENATSSTFQLSSLFKGVRTYSQAQLNEVREEWAKCVIHHFFD
ncbi:hypothetical protein C2S51_020667 [Perilla frutescens var. frutescens]|nr:hypothetical protein C2S51_020667 [Perilla frutescens var. frutescens]